MKRHLTLAAGFVALATPVAYLYLLIAAPGPATAVVVAAALTPGLGLVAVASFLLGWVTISTLSFPYSSDLPVAETSSNEGGIPIILRQVRVRWAESANPAA